MNSISLRNGVIAVAVTGALVLAGCSNSQKDSTESTSPTTNKSTSKASSSEASSHETSSASLALDDGYVKAKPEDKDMTAVFGTLHNTTDKDITITGFSTDLPSSSAAKYEIHEVVDGKMKPKEGGITIPANGMHELRPGSEHLMIMNYNTAIKAGDKVTVELKVENGNSVKIKDVPVRTISSGEESYGADGGVEGHNGMSEAPNASEHHHDEHAH